MLSNWLKRLSIVAAATAFAITALTVVSKNITRPFSQHRAEASQSAAKAPAPAFPDPRKIEVRHVALWHPSIQAAYKREDFPKGALENFAAFHSYVQTLYERAAPFISANWGIGQKTVERAAFYSIVVGTLFAYGNKHRPDLAGCSNNNEILGGDIKYTQSQRQFLNSPIGCCNDYAYLMKILLDLDGVENRMLVGIGHIWNEFVAGGRHYNIDANTGLLVASSWSALGTAKKLLIWEYPLAGAMPSAGERYRPELGGFAAYFLARISAGGYPVEIWDKIPREFPLQDGSVSSVDRGANP